MADQTCEHDDPEAARRAERVRKAVYTYAIRQGLSEPDAEDCAQECVLRLLKDLGPALLPPKPVRNLDSWLHASVLHDVRDYLRHLASERRHTTPLAAPPSEDGAPRLWQLTDDGPTPEDMLERALFWRHLAAALDSLDGEEYICFVCRHLLHEPVQEIAAAIRKSPNHVSKVLARAARHVREHLAGQQITAPQMQPSFDLPSPMPPSPTVPNDAEQKNVPRVCKTRGRNRERESP